MTIAAIIVAAGKGLRLGGEIPKQYRSLGGHMVLTHTLQAFVDCAKIDRMVCVISPEMQEHYQQAIEGLHSSRLLPWVPGGADRAGSVLAGLEALAADPPDRVLIHDAARPFVTRDALLALCDAEGAALLAEPVVDALWRESENQADAPVSRQGLWRAQTPQAFPFDKILAAHRSASGPPALDDAETYRRAGGSMALILGSPDNFKITTAMDLSRAERIFSGERHVEYRTGQGFDVHRFAPGDGVWLCGVHIPHSARLDGHSDADVGLHALADALYGAIADGDIGRHFPPSDPQWKGAESHIFLAHAAQRVRDIGGQIVNTDLTLLAEAPRIAPHAEAMQERLGEILDLDPSRISIKATTMERMGFIGREEGIGCIASATVALPADRVVQ